MYMKNRAGQWVRNPYQSPNPWVRQMVMREPEIYWQIKNGARFTDVDSGENCKPIPCPKCHRQMWMRPTVGKYACPDCGWIAMSQYTPEDGFDGHSCDA